MQYTPKYSALKYISDLYNIILFRTAVATDKWVESAIEVPAKSITEDKVRVFYVLYILYKNKEFSLIQIYIDHAKSNYFRLTLNRRC